MKRKVAAALLASLFVLASVAPAVFAAQPQSGQPGLTEGQNGPPPFPHHGGGGGQPQSGQPGLTEGQNGPPPSP
jgi:Spy/CpxP family protein refolding chaperone